MLDDITRDEEGGRFYPVLGLVWSDIGGEDKFEVREERPGEQRAFALRLDKVENMNDKLHMQSRVFQHDLQAAKVIHSRMNQGNSLLPPDEMTPLTNKIKEARKLSRKAFELTWERHPLKDTDKRKTIQACQLKNIKICNYPVFRLPKGIVKRFRNYWQNAGEKEFYSKIVKRARYFPKNQ